jgi:hypothetical protein
MFPTRKLRLCLPAVGLAVVCLGLTFQTPPAADAQTAVRVEGEAISPAAVATVNFAELSNRAAARQTARFAAGEEPDAAPVPGTVEESAVNEAAGDAPAGGAANAPAPAAPELNVASPAPAASFLAQEDSPRVGTNTITIPPDTMGAVGRDKIFVNLNNNYRVQDKATGAPLSTVSINTFWAATGATGVFDPRVQYDPYNDRWLVSAVSSAQTAQSSVLIGVSQTSDPQGSWTLFRFVVGCAAGAAGCDAAGEWADFPMLGFNRNWVAVTWNQFRIGGNGGFVAGRMIVLDYPQLRAGALNAFGYNLGANFCVHPATTYDADETTLYFAQHISSGAATYRVWMLTGAPPAAPPMTAGAVRTRPGGGWFQPGGDLLPQQCVPGVGLPGQTCPATLRRIDSGDAFVRSNVVFRNGRIWYPQTIGLPAVMPTFGNARIAAQWTALNTDGTFFDGGRVEDPTATLLNNGRHYAYPSIAVNRHNDVLFGFSEFESDDFADAGYTFRFGTDPAGTMRDPVIYKEGEDYYDKAFGGARNRWGDYSHTVVDPVGDRNLWTIQEYAATRTAIGVTNTNSKWGTWWAKVLINAAPTADAGPDQTVECQNGSADVTLDGTGSTDPDGDPLTYTWTDENGNVIATGPTPTVTLPLGTHTITLTVTDPDGFSDTDTVTINVVDTTAPVISDVSATPNVLWPPNHKLVDVRVNYTATDSCCGVTSALSVTSNEPDNGTGDGDTTGDIVIVNPNLVRLRAERSGGGSGRIYTITITATDCAGNTSTATTTVVVPKSQGRQ